MLVHSISGIQDPPKIHPRSAKIHQDPPSSTQDPPKIHQDLPRSTEIHQDWAHPPNLRAVRHSRIVIFVRPMVPICFGLKQMNCASSMLPAVRRATQTPRHPDIHSPLRHWGPQLNRSLGSSSVGKLNCTCLIEWCSRSAVRRAPSSQNRPNGIQLGDSNGILPKGFALDRQHKENMASNERNYQCVLWTPMERDLHHHMDQRSTGTLHLHIQNHLLNQSLN